MKSLAFIFLLTVTQLSMAQNFNFGIKAGLNYNFSGNLTDKNELISSADDAIHGAKNSIGYHGGLLLNWKISDFFIKTEATYTQYQTQYLVAQNNLTLTTQKVDVPLLFGTKIIGSAYVFAGPDFQYYVSEDFSLENTNVEYNDFTLGLHLGVGVELEDFLLELRWDKALNNSEINILNQLNINDYYTIDNRPNQLLFSVGYKFD